MRSADLRVLACAFCALLGFGKRPCPWLRFRGSGPTGEAPVLVVSEGGFLDPFAGAVRIGSEVFGGDAFQGSCAMGCGGRGNGEGPFGG